MSLVDYQSSPVVTYNDVLDSLITLEGFNLAKVEDKTIVNIWLSLLSHHQVTQIELSKAVVHVCSTCRFPVKPVELLEWIQSMRERHQYALKRDEWANMVEWKSPDGHISMVDWRRIDGNRILPSGEINPNAIDPRTIQSLPEPPDEPTRRAMIRKLTKIGDLEVAGRFITLLTGDTSIERDELRIVRDEQIESARLAKERLDAEQSARVQEQINNLRSGDTNSESTRNETKTINQ